MVKSSVRKGSIRECCGIIANTIGPTPAKYRPLPHSTSEIREFLELAMKPTDVENWHEAQLTRVADQFDPETTDVKNICRGVGELLLKGSKRTEDLRIWANAGLLPVSVYNERHLLNIALSHVKSALDVLIEMDAIVLKASEPEMTEAIVLEATEPERSEATAESPRPRRTGSAARIANEYFIQIYKFLLVLVKVAYSKEFDPYFREWHFELEKFPDTSNYFDSWEPWETGPGLQHLSLAQVLPPTGQIPLHHFTFGDPHGRKPRVFRNERPYGPPVIWNTLASDSEAQKAGKSVVSSSTCFQNEMIS